MISLNQNRQTTLAQAHDHYQHHRYSEALQEYYLALENQSLSAFNRCLIQSVIAIIYVHLNNYPEAHRLLTQLQSRLTTMPQMQSEYVLLFIKVHSSLALIELLNCNEEDVYEHINKIAMKIKHHSQSPMLLRTTMKMLFGVESFSLLYDRCNLALQTIPHNGLMLASLSLNAEMTGNAQLSYQLEHKAYEIYKSKGQVVLMALSCKHLLHLSKVLSLSKTIIEVYQQELDRLMQTPQIYGISEQTLFRNYQIKIKIGANVAEMLKTIETHHHTEQDHEWLKRATLKKLKTISSSSPSIQGVICLIEEKGTEILGFMENSPFVKQILEEKVKQIEEGMKKIRISMVRRIWLNVLLMLPPSLKEEPPRKFNQLNRQPKKKISRKMQIVKICKRTEMSPIRSQYHSRSPSRSNFRSGRENLLSNFERKSQIEEEIKVQVKQKNKSKLTQEFMIRQNQNFTQLSNIQHNKTTRLGKVEKLQQSNEESIQKDQLLLMLSGKQIKSRENKSTSKILPSKIALESHNIEIRVEPQNKESSIKKQSRLEKKPQMIFRKLEKLTVNSPKIRKMVKMCHGGQYFMKRHFSSDGGEEKFFQLTNSILKWASDEDKIHSKYQQYKIKDIKGVAHGKVSQTFLKECNKQLEPWKCFSLILQKRTLDLYCKDQIDVLIWLPAITASLSGSFLSGHPITPKIPISLYSPGKVLWKRMLLKIQHIYSKTLKKQRKYYKNANAYAIILFGRDGMMSMSKISK